MGCNLDQWHHIQGQMTSTHLGALEPLLSDLDTYTVLRHKVLCLDELILAML